MIAYQNKYTFSSKEKLLKDYGEEWPSEWNSKKIDSFEKRISFFGDCRSSSFAATSLVSIDLSKYGLSAKNKIKVNYKLEKILDSVFKEISKINTYKVKYVDGYLFRYKKNHTCIKNVRDSKEYDDAKEWYRKKCNKAENEKDSWWLEHWAEGGAEYDLAKGKVNLNYLSNHSFGSAIDINPTENGMGATVWDIAPEIVAIMRKYGFYWGGFYESSKDPMHFEYLLNEIVCPKLSFSLPLALSDTLEINESTIKKFYVHTEKEFEGGYFPVGANTAWHGGLHLLGSQRQTVHAVADGVVVCARMPSNDPDEGKLRYGSRNFVLIRHGEGKKIWYSLYYHLKSISCDGDEAKEIAWLKSSAVKFKSDTNFRSVPSTEGNTPIGLFKAGDTAGIIDTSQSPWYKVIRADKKVGYINFNPQRTELVPAVDAAIVEKLDAGGKVVAIGKAVRAGDIIGYIGHGIVGKGEAVEKKPILHWEIFSSELLEGAWEKTEDKDSDYTCNSETIIKLIDKDRNKKLEKKDIDAFFADESKAAPLRSYACRFQSEWSVDWDGFSQRMKKHGIRAVASTLELYNFWKEVVEAEKSLPGNGKVWHYNPVRFLEVNAGGKGAAEGTAESRTDDIDEDIFDKDIFLYSPADNTYYRIDVQNADAFYDEVDSCNDFFFRMEDARMEEPEKAVSLIGKIKDEFIEFLKKGRENAKAAANAEDNDSDFKGDVTTSMKELLALNVPKSIVKKRQAKGNKNKKQDPIVLYGGWVYVRSEKVKNHWRKSSEKTLARLFDDTEKDEKGDDLKAIIKEKFKEKILKMLEIEKVWEIIDEKDYLSPVFLYKTKKGKDSNVWDFSAGAQLLRFTAGASVSTSVNLKNLETKIEVAGSATFALAEGKVTSTWYLPKKQGVNVPELLADSSKKIATLLGKSTDRKPQRTTLSVQQRQLFLRMIIKLEASGFAGASASFAFPRLELKPVGGIKKTGDPAKDAKALEKKNKERLGMVTWEGELFVGGQVGGSLSGAIEWSPGGNEKEWKLLASVEGGLAGNLGAALSGHFTFGYEDGRIRCKFKLQAAFIVGGKGEWDFDIGLIEGLEFIGALVRCVDYHYVAEISEELYEVLGAYKYLALLNHGTTIALGGLYVLKDIDEHAEKAKEFVREARGLYQKVSNFVDTRVQEDVFKVGRDKKKIIDSQVERLKTSPPETLARYLLATMKVQEKDDYIYITKVLDSCESDHEVRWVIRYLGLLVHLHELQKANPGKPSITFQGVTMQVNGSTVIASTRQLIDIMNKPAMNGKGKTKDEMLEKGVKMLLDFGGYGNREKQNDKYITQIKKIFSENGIKH